MKTLFIAAIMITATAGLALAPTFTSSAMAIRNGDSITTTTCTHNGNGETTDGSCPGRGNSAQENEQTLYKCRGKFTTTPC
jgi:hypothetical protein